uniref:Uncharacterized protein n=1 Tax=Rhizophora mucronata TaxID=61149 RepID=A0A2P2PY93_RHIMU
MLEVGIEGIKMASQHSELQALINIRS